MAKFHALYWWIDRWRKSSAYSEMNNEEQGAYRNLLDEATLRGGSLPLSERVLAKASGDAVRWPKVRRTVLRWFKKTKDGYRNETLDHVLRSTKLRMEKQARYRERQQK